MPSITRLARPLVAFAFLLAGGCGGDAALPKPPVLAVSGGDQQSALAETELPRHVVALLLDGKERPMVHAKVTWAPARGSADAVIALDSMTDANGNVAARWLLDTVAGMHTLDIAGPGGVIAHASAFANARPFSNVGRLPVETYEGSGEAVHPDFVRVPAAWGGDRFRLVTTPYPGGNQEFENPSFFTGSTGTSWSVPQGASNPLVTPLIGYYSDPDALYDPDANELRIYYRHVKDANSVFLIRSSDGVLWSAPELTVSVPNHMLVSPTVVRRSATEWLMWSVNAGAQGCGGASTVVELRRSTNGVQWTLPEPATLSDQSGFAWHIDVEWIPSRGEYWAVYPVKQAGSCVTDRLGFATSADGVQWKSFPSPLLIRGANEQMRDIIYRSSLDYDEATGTVSLWYSGASYTGGSPAYRWHLAWERMTLPALFARVNTPAWEAARADEEPNIPQLTNETAP